MPEYGLAEGLAQSLQYDQRINDLRYQEEAMRRAKEMSNAKSKMFADDLDFQNASNQFDNPIIKQKGKEIIAKIGAFVRENPDWEGDVNKRSQLNLLKRELKDNPDLIRGVASDNNYKQYVADLQEVAKNPNQHDSDAYNAIGEQWNNYLKFGNQNGEEAAKTEGPKAFLYSKPKDFIDVNKEFAAVGNNFKDMRVKTIKGGMGAYEEYANPDSLRTVASQMYAQNQRQIDKIAASKGMAPIDYVMAGINAHIPKKRDMGDYDLFKQKYLLDYKHKLESSGGEAANTYKSAIVDQMASTVPASAMGRIAKDSKTYLIAKDGSQIDLTGLVEPKYTGFNYYAYPDEVKKKFKNQKHDDGRARLRFAESVAFIPMDVAKENNIISGGFGWFSDPEVNDNFKGKAEIVKKTGEDGKVHEAVKVTLHSPFDVNNAANAGMFNTEVMTSKQVPLPESNYQDVGYVNVGGQNIAIGTVVKSKKDGNNYVVTANGFVKQ